MINKISAFFYRHKNKNEDFTLIARDCVGGIVYHQLKLKFLSPTINLFFTPVDFNKFCLHLKEYIQGELVELKDDEVTYPVGLLYPEKGSSVTGPVRVDFMHYDSFEQAYKKWNERKQRINWDNIYVLSTFCYPKEVATFSDKLVEDWNNIKFKKIILVDKKYGFDDEYIIEKPEECQEYAWLLYNPSKIHKWKRTFNKFNFIKFLNIK